MWSDESNAACSPKNLSPAIRVRPAATGALLKPGTLPITLSADPRAEFPLQSPHVRLHVNQRKTTQILGCFSLPLKQAQKPSDHTHCFTYLNLLTWTWLSPAAVCADSREVTWGPCCSPWAAHHTGCAPYRARGCHIWLHFLILCHVPKLEKKRKPKWYLWYCTAKGKPNKKTPSPSLSNTDFPEWCSTTSEIPLLQHANSCKGHSERCPGSQTRSNMTMERDLFVVVYIKDYERPEEEKSLLG